MSKHSRLGTFIVCLMMCFSTSLWARDLPSKIGSEIKIYRTLETFGVLFGWRYSHYRSEYFSIGGAGYTGQLSGTANGVFSYGGLVATFAKHWKTWGFELSIMGGGGGGTLDLTYTAGGVVLEPNLAIDFVLGDTIHTSLSFGYTWMPNTARLSGISVGLRFEFITDPENFDNKDTAQRSRPAPTAPTAEPVKN